MNLTLHAGVFAAVNSGLWFVQGMRHPWTHLAWLTEAWLVLWIIQLLSVLVQRPTEAERSEAPTPSTQKRP